MISIGKVTAVDATLGPQLGITDEKLASSPPANNSRMSSADSNNGIKVVSSSLDKEPLNTLARLRSAMDLLICLKSASLTWDFDHCDHNPLFPAIVTAISPWRTPTELSLIDPLVDNDVPREEAASAIEYSIASGSPIALTCLGASAANTVTAFEPTGQPRSSCNPGQWLSESASAIQYENLPGWPITLRSNSPGIAAHAFISIRRIALPIVALALFPGPNKFPREFIPRS